MCELVSITMAVGAVLAAHQQREQGKFQKGVADYNARLSENEAQEVRNQGTEAENVHRQQTAELISKQRAQLGASGIDIGSGSALALQEDSMTLGDKDASTLRSNYGRKADAVEAGAKLTRAEGAFAKRAGDRGAAATLISGAASAYSAGVSNKWYKENSSGEGTGTSTASSSSSSSE